MLLERIELLVTTNMYTISLKKERGEIMGKMVKFTKKVFFLGHFWIGKHNFFCLDVKGKYLLNDKDHYNIKVQS